MWLFFKNPLLISHFDPASVDWYFHYSQTIFQPEHLARVMYWGESIALPILAHVVGASKSAIAYKLFCASLMVSIIPIFTILSKPALGSNVKSFIFVNLFGLGFLYLREAGIGYPDPLTIILLGIATLSQSRLVVLGSITLAALSHFSMSAIAMCTLAMLFITTPQLELKKRINLSIFGFTGLLLGRGLLELWYWKFDYLHTSGRLQFIADKGIDFFISRYHANPVDFWLTPGYLFLLFSGCFMIYLLTLKKYWFVIAFLFSLALSYTVLFLTVDGLRGFAVTSTPAFFSLLVVGLYYLKPSILLSNK
jgi:hypothetical protein